MRTNLLLIHADQHRADCLGVSGHPMLQTPYLDALARDGACFTHAFTPAPVCTPARNSLLFGRWPSSHGAIANHDTEVPRPALGDLPTWSGALHDTGYHLSYVGKWGVSSERGPDAFGWHDCVPESEYSHWREDAGLPPVPHTNGYFGETDPFVTPAQSRPAWGADQTIRLLEAAQERDAPFVVSWNPSEPHPPCTPPEPYASLYDPADIAPWHNFADPLTDKPFIQQQMRRLWGIEEWTWADWQPVVARYYGMVTLLDAQIGRVLEALDRLGLRENTMVVYTGDHGDLLGAHGMFDKHHCFYDEIVRVPLMVRWPGHTGAGTVVDRFVCSELDLAATVCEAGGVALPNGFQGRSFAPLLDGSPAPVSNDAAFSQYMGGHLGLYSSRMVREQRWKYIWNAVAEDELYDLASDPGEIVNRAMDPACAEERQRLRIRLVGWMESIGDPLCNRWTRPHLLVKRPRF